MTIIHALVLGIVEGLTEFLPISSTAHLIFVSKILGITQTGFTSFFEVFIQSGAILAVVLIYFQYILNHKPLIFKLLVSFIPTAIVGLVLHKAIKTIFL
jgi:undecaprenyl-diphosphatase